MEINMEYITFIWGKCCFVQWILTFSMFYMHFSQAHIMTKWHDSEHQPGIQTTALAVNGLSPKVGINGQGMSGSIWVNAKLLHPVKKWNHWIYPLVNVYIAMERSTIL